MMLPRRFLTLSPQRGDQGPNEGGTGDTDECAKNPKHGEPPAYKALAGSPPRLGEMRRRFQ